VGIGDNVLIGFASDAPALNGEMADAELLRELGCERVLSAAQGVFITEDIIDYLRPGDVLVVADLARLESDLAKLIYLVERLHKAGVGLQVARTEIAPGTAAGDSFPKLCAILAEFCRTSPPQSPDRATRSIRARGRPAALPPEAQKRAERLLKSGRTSVNEIARVLNVSPATVYRYFPRGGRAEKLPRTGKSTRPPRAKTSRAAEQDD
jgi:DNA invertase Pin-like site-specific DNA recombinase